MKKVEKEIIIYSMWEASLIIAMSSFAFGYIYSCLNSCLVTGDNNSSSDCFNNKDSSCPKGTIYKDINLSLCNIILLVFNLI